MKWMPAKLGAEPKKIGILVALVVVAGVFYFTNRNSGDSASPARPPASTAAPGMPARQKARAAARVTQNGLNKNLQEFRPSLKPKDVDRSSVDPTLHTALLAKLQDVKAEGVTRSLFEFSTAPAVQIAAKEPDKIKPKPPFIGPPAPLPPVAKVTPVDPQAPPVPLKFYGFVNQARAGVKRAFFLDGDDIIVASEGDMVKKRYKIVRIGVNSAVVEDTQFKNGQQTLPLEAEQVG